MSGSHFSRGCRVCSCVTDLLRQKLLKQAAQVQGWPAAAIAHDRCNGVLSRIDVPPDARRPILTRWAGNADAAPRSWFAGVATFSPRSEHLPSRTRTWTRFIVQGQK